VPLRNYSLTSCYYTANPVKTTADIDLLMCFRFTTRSCNRCWFCYRITLHHTTIEWHL